jgi:hypothetical protein
MSESDYKTTYGCGTACTTAKDALDETMRRTIQVVLSLPSLRSVLYVDFIVASRRERQRQRQLGQLTAKAGAGVEVRELASTLNYVDVRYAVETLPSVTSSDIAATITTAVASGSFTLQLRILASAAGISLTQLSAGDVQKVESLHTPAPVITPTANSDQPLAAGPQPNLKVP